MKPKQTLANIINMLYNGKNDAIKFVNDYDSLIFDAKRKATKGEGFKILIPKQMLQRLPIALAQTKADNICENL